MAATWITPAGSLGVIPELQTYTLNLETYSPGSSVTYTLISGALPSGLSLASNGNISGNTLNVTGTITSNFTVRATDTIGAVADRSFNLTVASVLQPEITPNTGALSFQIAGSYFQQTFTLVDTSNLADTSFIILAGNVAPNLTLYANGNLFGHIEPVTANTNFEFDIRATDGTKFDNNYFSQWVINRKSLTADTTYYNTDNVSIITADTSSLYSPFLVTPAGLLGNVREGNNFNVQVLATDYDEDYLTYELVSGTLPTGLSLVANTGWITGTIPLSGNVRGTLSTFEVRAFKRFNTDFVSETREYSIQVIGALDEEVIWITSSNIGSIYNGEISELYVEAELSSGSQLQYSLVGNGLGGLPAGLEFVSDGTIAGRVSFETNAAVDTYTFTVRASDVNGLFYSDKEFTLNVNQRNARPYENLYVQVLPDRAGRLIYNELLNTTDIFPPDYIYRYWDPWFSKNTLRRMLFLTGLNPDTDSQYINAMTLNHYWKTLRFGEVKTAVAKDDNFNTVYEVVYIDIIDQQVNASGVGPNIAETVPTNSQNISTVYPNSFPNMIQRLAGNNTSTTTEYTFYTDANLTIENPNPNITSNLDYFGFSTSLYGDYVAVSAMHEDNDIEGTNSGNVYIFNATTGSLIANVGNNNGTAVDGRFGYSVSIDNQAGNVMAVGAPYDDVGIYTQTGTVTIFKTDTGDWSDITRVIKIDNPISSSNEYFGWSVSVSGKYVLVGAVQNDTEGSNYGRAYVYDTAGTLLHILKNPFTDWDPTSDQFGYAVAAYGQYGVVTSYLADPLGSNYEGAVAIFNLSTGQLIKIITNPNFYGGSVADQFGYRVAMSANYMAVTANLADEPDPSIVSDGLVYVYRSISGSWQDCELLYTLRNPKYGNDNSTSQNFGIGLAINDRYVVAGAYGANYPVSNSGVGYVFDLRNGQLVQTVPNPNPQVNDYFAWAPFIDKNNNIAFTTRGLSTSGNVYIFNPDSSTTSVDNSVGYQDRGILPRWMTSRQPDGTVLGFTRALVLCYTNPGRSAEVAYRVRNAYQDFNLIDFTIDRYEWDSILSNNYIKSNEAVAGTGYLIANTQSNIVTGNSTIFSGELAANATLYVGGVIIGNVVTITGNTTLVMDANSYSNVSNLSFTYSNIFLNNNYVIATGNISANTTSNVITGIAANITGTGTITGNTESTTITGTGTTFTTEATVGKNIYVSGNSIGTIRSIISANTLTVLNPLPSNVSSASFEIEGVSTLFTSELHIGDAVVVNTNVVLGYVSSITSDTSMNLSANSTANVNNLSYSHTFRDPYTTPTSGDKYLKYPQFGVLS
jgi:hypothetical protein